MPIRITIREAIRRIEADGWMLVATRGSHRQYKAFDQARPCDNCWKAVRRACARNRKQRVQTGRIESAMTRYAVVIEKAGETFSAYVPDLPGCIATAATVPEVETEIRGAIRMHLDGLREDGLPVPESVSRVEYI